MELEDSTVNTAQVLQPEAFEDDSDNGRSNGDSFSLPSRLSTIPEEPSFSDNGGVDADIAEPISDADDLFANLEEYGAQLQAEAASMQ